MLRFKLFHALSCASLLVPEAGVEPARAQGPGDFESPASASSATPAHGVAAHGSRVLAMQAIVASWCIFPAEISVKRAHSVVAAVVTIPPLQTAAAP